MNPLKRDRVSPERRFAQPDDSLVESALLNGVKNGGYELLAAPAYPL